MSSAQQTTNVYYPEVNNTNSYYAAPAGESKKQEYHESFSSSSYTPQSAYYTGASAAPPPPPPPMYYDSKNTTDSFPPTPSVIHSQPQVTQIIYTTQLGFKPQPIDCDGCGVKNVESRVEYDMGVFAWLSAGCCFVFGLWCGCCCMPCVMDSFKDAEHHCPKCGKVIGERSRL